MLVFSHSPQSVAPFGPFLILSDSNNKVFFLLREQLVRRRVGLRPVGRRDPEDHCQGWHPIGPEPFLLVAFWLQLLTLN